MAIYRIFPEKDTSLFSESPTENTGIDEILELGGYEDSSGVGRSIRSLIKFSTTEIQDVVDNKSSRRPISASLNLYLAEASNVDTTYTVYAYPVFKAWENGTGKLGDLPKNTTGASWLYPSGSGQGNWLTSLTAGVTASYASGQEGGGSWYTGSSGTNLESSTTFNLYDSQDLEFDVSNAVDLIYSSSLENNGFLLKLDNDVEFNTSSSMRLRYFSVDTNTIYSPYLEFKWDDFNYSTGSLSVLSSDECIVEFKNNKGVYKNTGKVRFRLNARPKYPARTFTTSSVYLTNYALPTSSFWSLQDYDTGETFVDFSSYTKVSCDSTGPYFDVYLEGIEPERYYKVLVKTTIDESTLVFDDKNIFKIEKYA